MNDNRRAEWDQYALAELEAKDAEVSRLRTELDALKAALPKTADGEVVVVGTRLWVDVTPEGSSRKSYEPRTVLFITDDFGAPCVFIPRSPDGSAAGYYGASSLYRRHPVTGNTPEECE